MRGKDTLGRGLPDGGHRGGGGSGCLGDSEEIFKVVLAGWSSVWEGPEVPRWGLERFHFKPGQ